MKKIVLILSFLFCMPCVVWAADYCTNPKDYTVDKRCYVTDEQKKEKPYNAVVRVEAGCTGTIVERNGVPFLLTAKHCTDGDEDYAPKDTLTVELQDGTKLFVSKLGTGDYDIENDINYSGDWAVYNVNLRTDVSIPRVSVSEHLRTKFSVLPYDAYVIGYGMLKIMSDKDIDDFRQKYIKYLKDEHGIERSFGNETEYGFTGTTGSGIYTKNTYVQKFIKQLDFEYFYNLFVDRVLKVSKCRYSGNGKVDGCQGWRGNSGGGIFDNDGNIMGVATRAYAIIGGPNHAKLRGNINVLENFRQKLFR